MKPLPYSVGLAISGIVLFFGYTDGGFHSHPTFYAAATASSYVVYSSVAFLVTRYGRKRQSKAWLFFSVGVTLMFVYIPVFRVVIDLFYVERFRGIDSGDPLPVVRELFFYGPVIVGALCIFRAYSLWSEIADEANEPIQPPEPTRSARGPSVERSAK
ncbi:MAG: hypothetical protein NTV51_29005 [Verrucomicrobia bacterium]|nr:hypothetical protein [Verrucomicrobiota bacterium]